MPYPDWHKLTLVIFAACAGGGCLTVPHQAAKLPAAPPARIVVFAVDGAGNFQAASKTLRKTLQEARIPIEVETFEWSHGAYRLLADQMDHSHTKAEGKRLAGMLTAYRQRNPECAIHLFGHSAGCAVILEAAADLPPDFVEEIVLLAPSVSTTYDLRPGLRGAHKGIDVFYSSQDKFALGMATAVLGTADRRWTAAAGRVGFHKAGSTRADDTLYAKLHQHAWEPSLKSTGNDGGHYGGYQPGFLQAHVLPLMHGPT